MTDKDFKRLSRSDLIDIIYQLQKNEANLVKMNEELKARLASKEMKIENAGSIAEAAVSVSGVFEKAQQAADIYLSELHRANADLEEECKAKIAEAEEKAAQIIADAEKKASAKIAAASQSIQQYIQEHPQLHAAPLAQEDSDAR